jgi:hypothetical protein
LEDSLYTFTIIGSLTNLKTSGYEEAEYFT